MLTVKIDNTSGARPRIGLSLADVVYVTPVEGGLTRLLVVFARTQPPEVGPVRSARETDGLILANYGKVAFAYAGASPFTLATLRGGPEVHVSLDTSTEGFRRDSTRPAPYNVIGTPSVLLARAGGSAPAGDVGFVVAPAPAGGTATAGVRAAYGAARIEARWDAGRAQYLITTDGRPEISDGQQIGAATVIVQSVATRLSDNRDVNNQQTPVAEIIGSGAVEVHRGGLRYAGTWRRESATAPTVFTAADGTPLTVADGPVWVLLVPSGQGVSGL